MVFLSQGGSRDWTYNDVQAALGIKDLDKPDYGDAIEVKGDEIPVFWPCGVTMMLAVEGALHDTKHPLPWAMTRNDIIEPLPRLVARFSQSKL